MISQPRLPYAARTLIAQVKREHPDAHVEQSGLDVLNVYRVIRFDAKTSEVLAPVLHEIDDPLRIASTRVHEDHLVVTFTRTRHADNAAPFPLEAAADVAHERVMAGTVAELKAWVGDSRVRARQAYAAEQRRDKPRATLVGWLEGLLHS